MYKRGDCFEVNGFTYVAFDVKKEKDEELAYLVSVSRLAMPATGRWISQKLLPFPHACIPLK